MCPILFTSSCSISTASIQLCLHDIRHHFFFLNQLFIDLKNLLFDIFKNSLCAAAKYKLESFQTFAEVKNKN